MDKLCASSEVKWLAVFALIIIIFATTLDVMLGRGWLLSPLIIPLSEPGLSASFSIVWFFFALKGAAPVRLASWGALCLAVLLWLVNYHFDGIGFVSANPLSIAYVASALIVFYYVLSAYKHPEFSVNLSRMIALFFTLASTITFLYASSVALTVYDQRILVLEKSLSINTYSVATYMHAVVPYSSFEYLVRSVYVFVTLEFLFLLALEAPPMRRRIFWLFLGMVCGGYCLYFYAPAIGPTALREVVPQLTATGTLSDLLLVQTGAFPRNAFPSLHAAFGLLLLLRAQGFVWYWRSLFSILGIVNIIATVYLGEHWVLDLVPSSALLVLMLCLGGIINASWKRACLSVVCFSILLSWLMSIRYFSVTLLGYPALVWGWIFLSVLIPWLGLFWANTDQGQDLQEKKDKNGSVGAAG